MQLGLSKERLKSKAELRICEIFVVFLNETSLSETYVNCKFFVWTFFIGLTHFFSN